MTLKKKNGETLIKDHVRYKVPFSIAGDFIANRVRRQTNVDQSYKLA